MRRWLAVSICVAALGCINTSVHHLDDQVRTVRSADSVAVLQERPARPYVVIAVIETRGESVFDSFDDMRDEMVAEAAKIGGEAVIVGQETTDTNFILTGIAMVQSDTRKLTGEVIVYEGG